MRSFARILPVIVALTIASLAAQQPPAKTISKYDRGLGLTMLWQVKADLKEFEVLLRVDTPQEVLYYEHGGILPYVLRQLVGTGSAAAA